MRGHATNTRSVSQIEKAHYHKSGNPNAPRGFHGLLLRLLPPLCFRSPLFPEIRHGLAKGVPRLRKGANLRGAGWWANILVLRAGFRGQAARLCRIPWLPNRSHSATETRQAASRHGRSLLKPGRRAQYSEGPWVPRLAL